MCEKGVIKKGVAAQTSVSMKKAKVMVGDTEMMEMTARMMRNWNSASEWQGQTTTATVVAAGNNNSRDNHDLAPGNNDDKTTNGGRGDGIFIDKGSSFYDKINCLHSGEGFSSSSNAPIFNGD